MDGQTNAMLPDMMPLKQQGLQQPQQQQAAQSVEAKQPQRTRLYPRQALPAPPPAGLTPLNQITGKKKKKEEAQQIAVEETSSEDDLLSLANDHIVDENSMLNWLRWKSGVLRPQSEEQEYSKS